MNLKKEFNVVFQPKDASLYGKRRFIISVNSLPDYIGSKNAFNAVLKALDNKGDKLRKNIENSA